MDIHTKFNADRKFILNMKGPKVQLESVIEEEDSENLDWLSEGEEQTEELTVDYARWYQKPVEHEQKYLKSPIPLYGFCGI